MGNGMRNEISESRCGGGSSADNICKENEKECGEKEIFNNQFKIIHYNKMVKIKMFRMHSSF